MKDGQVIENGGYKALLEQDGAFASMWKKQIFTEAEMMAQAGDGGEGDLIDLDADASEGGLRSSDGGGAAGSQVVATTDQIMQEVEELKGRGEGGQGNEAATQEVHEQRRSETAAQVEEVPKGESAQDDVKVDGAEAKGFEVAQSNEEPPASYAEAVKAPTPEEASPITEDLSTLQANASPNDPAKESETKQQVATASDPTPAQVDASPQTNRASVPFPSTSQPRPVSWAPGSNITTPEKRRSFPRMTSSQSQASGISELGSDSTTPSRSNSRSDQPEGEETKMGDKARKRLSSIKGFVRRISDQGLSRSPSLGARGAKSPMGEMDETTAMLGGGSLERLVGEPAAGNVNGSVPSLADVPGPAQGPAVSQGEQGAKGGKGRDKKKKKNGKGKK
jgi:hypothetical protein